MGPFAACMYRSVKGNVAKQVKRIGIRAPGEIQQFVKINATVFQIADDLLPLWWIGPLCPQGAERRRNDSHLARYILSVLNKLKALILCIKLIAGLVDNRCLSAIKVVLLALLFDLLTLSSRDKRFSLVLLILNVGGICCGCGPHDFYITCDLSLRIDHLSGNLHRITIESWISKEPDRTIRIIDNIEVDLIIILTDAGSTSNNLFELGHRVNDAGNHNIFAGGHIYASGKHLWSSQDNRPIGFSFNLLKIVQVLETKIAFIRGNTTHIVRIMLRNVSIEISELAAHLQGMFLVNTEHNGLVRASCLLQKVG